MNKILETHFVEKYPKLFKDMYGDPKDTCMAWGISTDNGWFFLLDNLCAQIQSHIDERAETLAKGYKYPGEEDPIPKVVFQQIKEKFGTLRVYYYGGDEYIRALVRSAEWMSHGICEHCGKFNEEIGRTDQGWIRHLCSSCAEKLGKTIIQKREMISLWEQVKNTKENE